jgi:hypothetical protein
MPSIVVIVEAAGQNGSDVFDAETRMMTPKEADKYIPRSSTRMTVPEPHLSYNPQIAARQEAEYAKKVKKMAETLIPVRMFHGKTGKEPGFYVVSGEKAGSQLKLCIFDSQKRTWSERENYVWDGPHFTLDEAKAASSGHAQPVGKKVPA